MLTSRLQQTLLKRAEFIESLVLIHSYSQILTIKVHQYQQQSQKMFEKETILVEAFRNIFRIDETFRKFYQKLCLNIFKRLNPKYKRSDSKSLVKIHDIYFEFLVFFKSINELQMAKYLCNLQFESLSENQLFVKLTTTLIKYLKLKTEAVIEKLKQALSAKPALALADFKEEGKVIYEEIDRKQYIQRKRFNNFLRKSSISQSIARRKYSCEESSPKKTTQPLRKISNQLSFSNSYLHQSRQLQKGKGLSNIDWRIRMKKFQQFYIKQWQQQYQLIGIEQQLQQLKGKSRKIDEQAKKQWIYDNYRFLFQQMLSRNSFQMRNQLNKQQSIK